jgi:hypothetical protein
MNLQEFADNDLGLEANCGGVGSNERSTKDAGWPARNVVCFQSLQDRDTDLRLLGNQAERDLSLFTLST